MNSFWVGFEKRSGAITEALKRTNMNNPRTRSILANTVREWRNALRSGESRGSLANKGVLAKGPNPGSPFMMGDKGQAVAIRVKKRGNPEVISRLSREEFGPGTMNKHMFGYRSKEG